MSRYIDNSASQCSDDSSSFGPDATHGSPFPASEPVLAELAEQITQCLQAGERIDVDEYTRTHPSLAGAIHRLIPACAT